LYINHRDKGGVQGHIFVAVLAFLLERVLEKKLKAARIGLSAKAALEALRTVHIFYTNVKHGLGEPRAEA
jgi:transposase